MSHIVKVDNLKTIFGSKVVHDGLNLSVKKGEIYGILGSSGSGKTTLLREMLMLQDFHSGDIDILGSSISNLNYKEAQSLKCRWGVLFQNGALFTSLSVAQNIALPLREYTNLSEFMIEEIVRFKINIVGLKQSDANLFPFEISGGMRKKAGLARALALEPEILFLDEPTSGLDPISAREFDKLLLKLHSLLNFSVIMVSHDIKSILATLDSLAIIEDKHIVYEGSLSDIDSSSSSFVNSFFKGKI